MPRPLLRKNNLGFLVSLGGFFTFNDKNIPIKFHHDFLKFYLSRYLKSIVAWREINNSDSINFHKKIFFIFNDVFSKKKVEIRTRLRV